MWGENINICLADVPEGFYSCPSLGCLARGMWGESGSSPACWIMVERELQPLLSHCVFREGVLGMQEQGGSLSFWTRSLKYVTSCTVEAKSRCCYTLQTSARTPRGTPKDFPCGMKAYPQFGCPDSTFLIFIAWNMPEVYRFSFLISSCILSLEKQASLCPDHGPLPQNG